jgi:hypothetical protein
VKNKKEYFPEKVCSSCAVMAGGKLRTVTATWHEARCDVCGLTKPVTQPRDFGYPRFFKPA